MQKVTTQYLTNRGNASNYLTDLKGVSSASKIYVYNTGATQIDANGLLIPVAEIGGVSYEILGFDNPVCEVGSLDVKIIPDEANVGSFKLIEVFSVLP
jgi:hypothetical protein